MGRTSGRRGASSSCQTSKGTIRSPGQFCRCSGLYQMSARQHQDFIACCDGIYTVCDDEQRSAPLQRVPSYTHKRQPCEHSAGTGARPHWLQQIFLANNFFIFVIFIIIEFLLANNFCPSMLALPTHLGTHHSIQVRHSLKHLRFQFCTLDR